MATLFLYGLEHSSRDFSERDAWGKNVFHSLFPVALCNYFLDREIKANYLDGSSNGFAISEISIRKVYGEIHIRNFFLILKQMSFLLRMCCKILKNYQ